MTTQLQSTQLIDRTLPGPNPILLCMAKVSCRFSLRSEKLLMSNADGASAGKWEDSDSAASLMVMRWIFAPQTPHLPSKQLETRLFFLL